MKRFTAIMLALVMLLSAFCFAEKSLGIEDLAKDTISIVNYYVQMVYDSEQLFVGYQEIVEGEIFGFYTEDNSIQALLVGNTAENKLSSCSFICDVPEAMLLAMNCACTLPIAQLMLNGENDISDQYSNDMDTMATWFDDNYEAAQEAFENGESYSSIYSESEYFSLEWQIVPLEDHSRLMISYYFNPAEADQ